jgi:hypothetical protein
MKKCVIFKNKISGLQRVRQGRQSGAEKNSPAGRKEGRGESANYLPSAPDGKIVYSLRSTSENVMGRPNIPGDLKKVQNPGNPPSGGKWESARFAG